jgi:hypothetical protein
MSPVEAPTRKTTRGFAPGLYKALSLAVELTFSPFGTLEGRQLRQRALNARRAGLEECQHLELALFGDIWPSSRRPICLPGQYWSDGKCTPCFLRYLALLDGALVLGDWTKWTAKLGAEVVEDKRINTKLPRLSAQNLVVVVDNAKGLVGRSWISKSWGPARSDVSASLGNASAIS